MSRRAAIFHTAGAAVRRMGTLHASKMASIVGVRTSAWRTAPISGMKPGAATFQKMQHRSMAGTSSGPVAIIDDVDQYNDACSKAAGKLIVAYHTAAWCGPCKMIWPHVEELANSNPDVVFLKIDVDEAPDVAAVNQISAMPTFLLVKDGNVVDKLVGASPQQLMKMVETHK